MTTEEAGRRRWRGMTKKERSEHARKAVAAFWAKLTPEERSAEMRRRAEKRKKKFTERSTLKRSAG
jgi:hypothetical protein